MLVQVVFISQVLKFEEVRTVLFFIFCYCFFCLFRFSLCQRIWIAGIRMSYLSPVISRTTALPGTM